MSGRKIELFSGGPMAGWLDVTNALSGVLIYEDQDGRRMMYVRRRWLIPGWAVPIPIWTVGEKIPFGTVLPGLIQGCPGEVRETHWAV